MRSRIGVVGIVGCVAAIALLGCGGGSSGGDEALKEAEHKGAERAQQKSKIHQIQRELRELRAGKGTARPIGSGPAPESSSGPAPGETSDSGNCGGGLSANEYTTCGFAENVESAYFDEVGAGSGSISAYSPTTGQSYSMYCTAGEPHECTGGNNAAVFFP